MRDDEMKMVKELLIACGEAHNLRRLLTRSSQVFARRLHARRGELLKIDEARGVAQGWAWTAAAGTQRSATIALAHTQASRCLKTRRPALFRLEDDPQRAALAGCTTMLCFPLLDHDSGRGLLILYCADPDAALEQSEACFEFVQSVLESRYRSIAVIDRLARVTQQKSRALHEAGGAAKSSSNRGALESLVNSLEHAQPRVAALQASLERSVWLSCGVPGDAPAREEDTMESFAVAQERCIRAALSRTRGKIYGAHGAALKLGLKPSTLQSKMQKFGIDRVEYTSTPEFEAKRVSP